MPDTTPISTAPTAAPDTPAAAVPDAPQMPTTIAEIKALDDDAWAKLFVPDLYAASQSAPPADAAPETPSAEAETPAQDGPARDASGRFVAATAETPSEPAAETPVATTPPATDPVATLPFAVVGADGQPLAPESAATLQVSFKASGETITKPLAEVVRAAQSAEGQTRALNAKHQELTTLQQQLEAAAQQQRLAEQILERALQDDAVLEQLRQRYAEYASPEAEVERLRAQLEAQQRAQTTAQVQSAAADTLREVTGVLESLATTFPSVTVEELLGRFTTDTAQYAVNGVIDPQHHAAVRAYAVDTLTAWARERHTQRSSQSATLEARVRELEAKLQEASDRAAQAVKNAAAPPIAPTGAARPAAGSKPPITSVKDAQRHALAAFDSTT